MRLDQFTLGGPVELGFLTNARLLSSSRRELQQRLASFEDKFDVTAELSGYTRADLPELEEENIHLLAGIPPSPVSTSSFSARSHSDLDVRSLERAKRLRQSSPFLAVLNSKEKAQIRSSEGSHDT